VPAQDQGSAEQFGMPGATIATDVVDEIVSLDDLPAAICAQVCTLLAPVSTPGERRWLTRRAPVTTRAYSSAEWLHLDGSGSRDRRPGPGK